MGVIANALLVTSSLAKATLPLKCKVTGNGKEPKLQTLTRSVKI